MPLFEYIGPGGERREFLLPLLLPFLRVDGKDYEPAPVQSFRVLRGGGQSPMAREVLKGYRDAEVREGSRFRSRRPAEVIRRAWEGDKETSDDAA